MADFKDIKEDLLQRFSSEEILELMYQAGWKEPRKLHVSTKSVATIRCSKHADEEINDGKKKKRASCRVFLNSATFHCASCGDGGSLVDVAMLIEGTNSPMKGLQYLAGIKGYNMDLLGSEQKLKPIQQKPREQTQEKIKYFTFDPARPFTNYSNEELIREYESLSELMQFKAIMTVLIRHSLEVDQSKKIDFLCNQRMINPNNPRLKKVGFLPMAKDDREFWNTLENSFPILDLVKFGLYKPADHKYDPLSWKYKDVEIVVFPNQDLYSDLYHGAMLRPLVKPTWWDAKEMQLTCTRLIHPIPFALGREVLMSPEPIMISEGSVDGLSTDIDFSANPGIAVYHKPYLGLYRGKKVYTGYDMDRAGLAATFGCEIITIKRGKTPNKKASKNHIFPLTDKGRADALKLKTRLDGRNLNYSCNLHDGLLKDLIDAGIPDPIALVWDAKIGKDHNELRQKFSGKPPRELFLTKRLTQ